MEVFPFFDAKCTKSIEDAIAFLERQVKDLEEDLVSHAKSEYKKQMDLSSSIKGIGVTLVAALITVTGCFIYFDEAKQLARHPGLSPTYQQSGTSVNFKGHINGNGGSCLRSQFYVAAFASLRCDTKYRACHDRLWSKGKPGKVTVIAVAKQTHPAGLCRCH